MWLNVSGGMFNFSLCITAVNCLALLHCIAQDCREENGTMFNSAAKEKCKQVQSGKILLSFRYVQTFFLKYHQFSIFLIIWHTFYHEFMVSLTSKRDSIQM